jgi:hypothetical protein
MYVILMLVVGLLVAGKSKSIGDSLRCYYFGRPINP